MRRPVSIGEPLLKEMLVRRENERFYSDGKYLSPHQWFIDVDPIPVTQGQLIKGQ
jgi:hypothetical protein